MISFWPKSNKKRFLSESQICFQALAEQRYKIHSFPKNISKYHFLCENVFDIEAFCELQSFYGLRGQNTKNQKIQWKLGKGNTRKKWRSERNHSNDSKSPQVLFWNLLWKKSDLQFDPINFKSYHRYCYSDSFNQKKSKVSFCQNITACQLTISSNLSRFSKSISKEKRIHWPASFNL